MKKLTLLLIALTVILSVAGCGAKKDDKAVEGSATTAKEEGETTAEPEIIDIYSTDIDPDDLSLLEPGTAVMTSSGVSGSDVISEVRINREQIRAANKEMLIKIIDNEGLDAISKKAAINEIIQMNEVSQEEMVAEILLENKGYGGCVVTIVDGSVDVVVNIAELTDVQRAQIEDFVKRKTGCPADKIVILSLLEPGTAVMTSSGVSGSAVISEVKINREQIRAANREMLYQIIDNEGLDAISKQAAVSEAIQMTEDSEKEMAAELLLSARGYGDCVVTIVDGSVDVVVNTAELTDVQRAEIEDIVKRKTDCPADKIVISTINNLQ